MQSLINQWVSFSPVTQAYHLSCLVLYSCCQRQGFCLSPIFFVVWNLLYLAWLEAKWLLPICSIFTYRPLCVCPRPRCHFHSHFPLPVQGLSLFWWSCMHKHVAGRQLRWQATMRHPNVVGPNFLGQHLAMLLLLNPFRMPRLCFPSPAFFISPPRGKANWLRLMK